MGSNLSRSEQWQLTAFRRVARQVRDASIIARGEAIRLRTVPSDPGYVNVFVELLNGEAFRSLALSIRLAYQKGEPSNFLSVCNALGRLWPDSRDRVGELRRRYLAALRDEKNAVRLPDGSEPATYTAEQVFEAWLYGVAFHQDVERQETVARLEAEGAMFLWSVQATSLQLAGRIMDLDDVIADVTEQERLPRL